MKNENLNSIDRIDRKILYALDCNARAPLSSIGAQQRIGKETVRYRVSKLRRQQVIQKFFTVVDPAKFGCAYYKILLKLHSVSETDVDSLVQGLLDSRSVGWLVKLEGAFDISVVVSVESLQELDDFVMELMSKFGHFILERTISINLYGTYLPRCYLTGVAREEDVVREYSSSRSPYELDTTNRAILKLLTQNARLTNAEIAEKLRSERKSVSILSAESIRQRIKTLEKDGVIRGYNLVLNHSLLKQLHYKVLLVFNQTTKRKLKRFEITCKAHPRIVYLIKAIGMWDYELDLEVESVSEYREIVMGLTRTHPGIIRNYTGLQVTKIFKYNLFPD